MTTSGIDKLRDLWKNLKFAKVDRVITREPDDVVSIEIPRIITTEDGLKLRDHTDYYIKSRLTKDIPVADRWRARIAWKRFFGFTEDNIYFQADDFRQIDFDIDLTMYFGERWGNHTGGRYTKPERGTVICGEVIETSKGKRFRRWFVCDPAFRFLHELIMNGTTLSEKEVAPKLMCSKYPDLLFAIALLAIYNDVEPFVVTLLDREHRPEHPAKGASYGEFFGDKQFTINHTGLWLSKDTPQYVHEISHQLNVPAWWEEFNRIASERGIAHSHPPLGGLCIACPRDWDDTY